MDTTKRSTCWSLTINNPTADDEEAISIARQRGWKVEGQLEKGENGTPHYQLCLNTPQVRFSAVKNIFKRAHIEIARNKQALQQYVVKEDTREGQLLQQNELFPSQQKVWDLFATYVADRYENRDYSVVHEWNGEQWLKIFDECVCDLIKQGYVVEGIAVNPQTRTSLNKYGLYIYQRSMARLQNEAKTSTQTEDRQTDS